MLTQGATPWNPRCGGSAPTPPAGCSPRSRIGRRHVVFWGSAPCPRPLWSPVTRTRLSHGRLAGGLRRGDWGAGPRPRRGRSSGAGRRSPEEGWPGGVGGAGVGVAGWAFAGPRGPGGGVLCPGGMGSFSLVVEVVARGSGRPRPVVPGCHVGAVWGQVGMGASEVGHLQGTGDV